MTRKFSKHLTGATLVVPGTGVIEADLVIDGEKIAGLVERGAAVEADERIDLTGLTVFPGGVDVHLHLGHGNDISRPRVPSDAASETAAALLGGVTSFIPYVMSGDPYESFFTDMKAVTEAGARIDFSYHFIIASEAQLASLPHYVNDLGVPTAKLFMNIRGDEGKRLGLPGIDDGFMFRLLEALGPLGGMMCPHPENIEIGWALSARMREIDPEGHGGLSTWNAARPSFIEAEAIRRATYFGKVTGTPVYCVHTSSAEALQAALAMRRDGCPVFIETCSHYLVHDVDSDIGMAGKINPPLRESADREALWKAVADGHVDTIGTDHVHRTMASKQGGIWSASPGCPGLDTFLPLLVSEGHHKRGIPLERIAALTSANPARIMGLGERKGGIAVGLDADLAIVDLNEDYVVGPETRATDAGYSLYDGMTLRGRVVHALTRGRFALRDHRLLDEAVGTGRFLRRRLPPHPIKNTHQ
ncbi:dihydroorotase family protein [Hoeflea sp. YIM 152468]|uniref:dihydroorotase n=1 Tax=Hoeflea sp. YIM 152468 TaxID=3031759 RepID=UPI0023DA3593|nr:dihydroorotase family protein [Hoeflea sp. YIM 152468]MDF1609074.1 dihydroorotase family protein [Hoeflea sp. YIM 152468]